jgi:hypothetical protein
MITALTGGFFLYKRWGKIKSGGEKMKRGERMESFVKIEKELESDYRRALEEVKRPDEVHKVFTEFIFKLLKRVREDIDEDMMLFLKLTPEDDKVYKIDEKLLEFLGEDLVKRSDLLAIIGRMAQSAAHRYLKLKRDDERTDLFRLGEGSKVH